MTILLYLSGVTYIWFKYLLQCCSHCTFVPNVRVMTSDKLTSHFDFWCLSQYTFLCIAMLHLPTKFYSDVLNLFWRY